MNSELMSYVAELGEEELRVLCHLAQRLLWGQRAYGKLELAKDTRHWAREGSEELQDFLVYSSIAAVSAKMRGGR
jgi:hypothetical protein